MSDEAEVTRDEVIKGIVHRVLTSYLEGAVEDQSALKEWVSSTEEKGFLIGLDLEKVKGRFSIQLHPLAITLFEKFDAQINDFIVNTPEGALSFDWKGTKDREEGLKVFTDLAICYLLPKIGHYIGEAIESLVEQSFCFAKTAGCVKIAKTYDRAVGIGVDIKKLTSVMKDTVRQVPLDKQEYVREALEHHTGLQVQSTKGRPRTWTKEGLEKAVRKASFQARKEKYRVPRLNDVAEILNKRYPDRTRLTGKGLGQMLTRYEISWKEIKNPHN